MRVVRSRVPSCVDEQKRARLTSRDPAEFLGMDSLPHYYNPARARHHNDIRDHEVVCVSLSPLAAFAEFGNQ